MTDMDPMPTLSYEKVIRENVVLFDERQLMFADDFWEGLV